MWRPFHCMNTDRFARNSHFQIRRCIIRDSIIFSGAVEFASNVTNKGSFMLSYMANKSLLSYNAVSYYL